MKNFVSNGNSVQLIAPVGGVVGGAVYGVQNIIGVVVASAAQDEQFTLSIKGVFSGVKKKAAEAWAQGQTLYYDPATGELTTTAGVLKVAGYAADAALAADVIGNVILK